MAGLAVAGGAVVGAVALWRWGWMWRQRGRPGWWGGLAGGSALVIATALLCRHVAWDRALATVALAAGLAGLAVVLAGGRYRRAGRRVAAGGFRGRGSGSRDAGGRARGAAPLDWRGMAVVAGRLAVAGPLAAGVGLAGGGLVAAQLPGALADRLILAGLLVPLLWAGAALWGICQARTWRAGVVLLLVAGGLALLASGHGPAGE